MNYITAEQFLQQPEEVQKVLLDWWQPCIGDLTTGRYSSIAIIQQPRDIEAVKIYKGQPYTIPLFSETQLRNFIEEKTKKKYDIIHTKNYINFYEVKTHEDKALYITRGQDLLQAYWQIVCLIAKEG